MRHSELLMPFGKDSGAAWEEAVDPILENGVVVEAKRREGMEETEVPDGLK